MSIEQIRGLIDVYWGSHINLELKTGGKCQKSSTSFYCNPISRSSDVDRIDFLYLIYGLNTINVYSLFYIGYI